MCFGGRVAIIFNSFYGRYLMIDSPKLNAVQRSDLMTSPPIVHIVDDDDSFRRAMLRLLQASGFAAQAHASAADFLLGYSGEIPGCVLLDVQMPGLDGLDLQAALVKKDASMPVVFLTGHGDIPMSVRAMKTGAVDFLTKPVKREDLLRAVRDALTRDEEQRGIRQRLRKYRRRWESLTSREREVFERITAGRLNKQVAQELVVSERTIKAHRANIMQKMEAESLAELVQIAVALRLKPDFAKARTPG